MNGIGLGLETTWDYCAHFDHYYAEKKFDYHNRDRKIIGIEDDVNYAIVRPIASQCAILFTDDVLFFLKVEYTMSNF